MAQLAVVPEEDNYPFKSTDYIFQHGAEVKRKHKNRELLHWQVGKRQPELIRCTFKTTSRFAKLQTIFCREPDPTEIELHGLRCTIHLPSLIQT